MRNGHDWKEWFLPSSAVCVDFFLSQTFQHWWGVFVVKESRRLRLQSWKIRKKRAFSCTVPSVSVVCWWSSSSELNAQRSVMSTASYVPPKYGTPVDTSTTDDVGSPSRCPRNSPVLSTIWSTPLPLEPRSFQTVSRTASHDWRIWFSGHDCRAKPEKTWERASVFGQCTVRDTSARSSRRNRRCRRRIRIRTDSESIDWGFGRSLPRDLNRSVSDRIREHPPCSAEQWSTEKLSSRVRRTQCQSTRLTYTQSICVPSDVGSNSFCSLILNVCGKRFHPSTLLCARSTLHSRQCHKTTRMIDGLFRISDCIPFQWIIIPHITSFTAIELSLIALLIFYWTSDHTFKVSDTIVSKVFQSLETFLMYCNRVTFVKIIYWFRHRYHPRIWVRQFMSFKTLRHHEWQIMNIMYCVQFHLHIYIYTYIFIVINIFTYFILSQ